MKKAAGVVLACTMLAAACTRADVSDPIRVGAIYPLSGSQGSGGVDEHRGVELAAELANDDGGVDGRPIELTSVDVPSADAAPAAVHGLEQQGIRLVLGSYGSTISEVAARTTAADGLLFWETGAVGMLPADAARGELTFRMPPTGAVLGRNAISFVADVLAPRLNRDPSTLRWGVSFVRDVYGRSVARGALDELHAYDLPVAGRFGYDPRTADLADVAKQVAAARIDVLFVSAYLEDGIALRRALYEQHVPLVANIGTSSSYCMPEFGAALGDEAVGVFASDKPDAAALNPDGLAPDAASLLRRANDAFRERYGEDMSPAALAGFSAGWALFTDVMPAATDPSAPESVASAARAADLPRGSMPNGSGVRFGAPGTPDAGDNLRAAGVIWEWVAPGVHVAVWPPQVATQSVAILPV
jgi:branched-chain amino acid transport system substrate-binding protein